MAARSAFSLLGMFGRPGARTGRRSIPQEQMRPDVVTARVRCEEWVPTAGDAAAEHPDQRYQGTDGEPVDVDDDEIAGFLPRVHQRAGQEQSVF